MLYHQVKTLVIALVGVGLFLLLNLPLPWLFGPLAACLIAALFGLQMIPIKPVNEAMRTILGVAVGATITVTFLHSIADLWSTLIFIPVMVFLIGLIGIPYFQRLWGYDWATS